MIADRFRQPPGPRLALGAVRGYPLDMRSKAPDACPAALGVPGGLIAPVIQQGLGAYERHLAGDGEDWLALAVRVGEELLRSQQRGGARDGGWLHLAPCPHTYRVAPPWLSGLAQGEGASLLVRLAGETGDERYAEAALRALGPLRRSIAAGGVLASLDGHAIAQEYPTDPGSHVLNGAVFALWGQHDVAVALGDPEARQDFEVGVDALVATLPRWDTGHWSRYDLHPHPVVNVASPAYHRLHIDQLEALGRMTGHQVPIEVAARFRAYAARPANRARALGAKTAFRIVVPRSPRLARLSPFRPLGLEPAP
jgi:heparosan-N-sulfate-glucuronate 5-epimerase